MCSLVAVMKEKVDSMTAAITQAGDDTLKGVVNGFLKKWKKISERYTNMRKERLHRRSSDTVTYCLLSEDFILESNSLLGKKFKERQIRDDEERAKAKDEDEDDSDIDKLGSKGPAPKRSRKTTSKSPAPKRSRKMTSKSSAPLSVSSEAVAKSARSKAVAKSARPLVIDDDGES